MVLLVDKLKLRQLLKIPVRYKNPKHHWSVLKKRKTSIDKALEHFDDFYATVYGKVWEDIRAVLLGKSNKYVAVVNNFSDSAKAQSDLELLGAVNLKNVYDVYKEDIERRKQMKKQNESETESQKPNKVTDDLVEKAHLAELEALFPGDHSKIIDVLKAEGAAKPEAQITDPSEIKLQSIEQELNEVEIDSSRIIEPNVNLSLLHEYVPATKIKGLDDWVLESDQYKFYTKAQDFKVDIVKESVLSFPEHLHVYIHEKGNNSRFPNPKIGTTGVRDYYLMDAGSILPVLALDIQPNDVVLDMCAAPGGKTLAILQTLLPQVVVANDVSHSRVRRIKDVIQQFGSDIPELQNMFVVTEMDARAIDEKNVYNKILADVPCTTDRHVLRTDENNIFSPSRIKERLKIPEIQAEILSNAFKLVMVGGTVVYSTCTLSPIQNDGVVQVALKKVWEETGAVMAVKDMSEALLPLKSVYSFGTVDLKYGHIIIPTVNSNCGPMYFCKIEKVQDGNV
ncbi:5-methylcytosine rRNA methyltransferase l(2)10685 isoform X2 [Megachile rotundata]|uniref:5-methylcytosine rRNA methyltransferase l(2)10685 isoform X2 n=1 Tax=Megachile rotundata TaxID=143995 RepID=UPI000614E59A|nr:PREDICTED: 5-methylcytosine rRNA methyltransferase NSUN4 isoform X1 [Megachile rotundata]